MWTKHELLTLRYSSAYTGLNALQCNCNDTRALLIHICHLVNDMLQSQQKKPPLSRPDTLR